MTDDRSRSLVPQGPDSLSVVSRLAERTLAERSARSDALAVVGRNLVVGPGGYATIGEAVALALDGDTVLVRPGTYHESVTITRAITLVGDGNRDDILIESQAAVPEAAVPGSLLDRIGNAGRPAVPAACLILDGSTARVANLTIRGDIRICNGARGIVEGNDISGCHIEGAGTDPLIRSNRIHDSGMWVGRRAAGTIEDNEILDGRGINVYDPGAAPIIRANRIHDLKGAGVAIMWGAGATIENNDIFSIGEYGIYVCGEGSAPTIRGNRIHDNDGTGIRVAAAAGEITGNEVYGNHWHGIVVSDSGAAPLVQGNFIHDCDGSGILVGHGMVGSPGAGGRIVGNTISRTTEEPIRIDPGSTVNLGDNVFG